MDIAQEVLQTIHHDGLIARGDSVLVAVSGGGDSVAMLHVLASLAADLGCKLHIAHLNHGIRPESAYEAQFVRQLGKKLNLPVTIEETDVPGLRAANGGSLEQVARRARYDFFFRTALAVGANAVATGHNEDDQIETVVHNLLRGGGVQSLCGIQIARPIEAGSDIKVVRPVLRISRIDLLMYLAENGIDFCTDESNANTDFTRNRIRNELMPLLEQRFNPSVGEAILRVAESAESAARIFNEWIEINLPAVFNGNNALVCSGLLGLDKIMRGPLVERAMEIILPRSTSSYRHIRAVVDLLDEPPGAIVNLPVNWRAFRTGDRIEFRPFEDAEAAEPLDALLKVPGCVSLFDDTLTITAELLPNDSDAFEGFLQTRSRWEEMIDADTVGEHLRVRSKHDGDRFYPLGGPGVKKLQDFFVDEKVPASRRNRTPLLVGDKGIVWVVGHRIDERVRVTGKTKRLILLKAEWRRSETDE